MRPLLTFLTAVAVCAGLAPAALGASGHSRGFVPKLGNWEGSAYGVPISFALRRDKHMSVKYHLPPFAYTHLVVPNPCIPVGSGTSSFSYEPSARSHLISAQGVFLNRDYPIRLKSARSATLTLHPKGADCPADKMTWHFHPTHRVAVRDGTWALQYSDGESSEFTVHAGGRIASMFPEPQQALSQCGWFGVGALDYFIGANGGMTVTDSETLLTLDMHFSGQTASGTAAVQGPSCEPLTLTAEAHRTG